jgi:hypothetical protein
MDARRSNNHHFASTYSRSRGVTGYQPYPSHNRQYLDRQRSPSWNPSHHPSYKKRRHHLTQSEEDFYLPKLVNAIPKYNPLPFQTKKMNKQRSHVCLLFLTIDDLPLEAFWRAFFDSQYKDNNIDSDMMVSVICHAKFPEKVQSPWLKKRLMTLKPSIWEVEQYKQRSRRDSYAKEDLSCLPPIRYFSRRPEWGSIEITRAMIDLLDEGLRIGTSRDNTDSVSRTIKDPRQASEYRERYCTHRYVVTKSSLQSGEMLPTVDRFIFVSETCLPVVTMSELEVSLFGKLGEEKEEELSSSSDINSSRVADGVEASRGSLFAPPSSKYSGEYANKSWVNARNTPNNGYARQLQWDAMDPAVPPMHIWKADQWILLTRHHAWPLLSLVDEAVQNVQASCNRGSDNKDGKDNRDALHLGLWQCFRKVKASDEMYFPTLMSLLGMLGGGDCKVNNDNPNQMDSAEEASRMTSCNEIEVCTKRVTYCDWSENAKNPATFVISRRDNFKEFRNVIKLAREEGCLLARKFTMQEDELDATDQGENDKMFTGEGWLELIRTCN